MNIPTTTLSEPFPAYGPDSPITRITYRDGDHVPYNKRRGSCKSIFNAEIDRSEKFVAVRFTEITTNRDSDRSQARTISMSVPLDVAQRIAEFINTGK